MASSLIVSKPYSNFGRFKIFSKNLNTFVIKCGEEQTRKSTDTLGTFQEQHHGLLRIETSMEKRNFKRFFCSSIDEVCGDAQEGGEAHGEGGDAPGGGFFNQLQDLQDTKSKNKITVIGVGQVGMACAVSCLANGITTDLYLYDVSEDKAKGEVLDLEHASLFLHGPRISVAKDLTDTANSEVVIITAGARQRPGEKRSALLSRNVDVFKSFVPAAVRHSPNAIFLVVSNPVDVMTYVTWKLSGLPTYRVVGAGTNLDTSRFRQLIAKRMNINVSNVHGWIIGEHGDSSVAVWSGTNVAGVPVRRDLPKIGEKDEDKENWNQIHQHIVHAADEVISLKGYTSWGVGFSVGQITKAILKNTKTIHPVSTFLMGEYGVKDEIFSSVPCLLGQGGIISQIRLPLTPFEQSQFDNSMEEIGKLIAGVNL